MAYAAAPTPSLTPVKLEPPIGVIQRDDLGAGTRIPRKDDQPVPERAEGLVLLLTVYRVVRVATNAYSRLWISGQQHPGC